MKVDVEMGVVWWKGAWLGGMGGSCLRGCGLIGRGGGGWLLLGGVACRGAGLVGGGAVEGAGLLK